MTPVFGSRKGVSRLGPLSSTGRRVHWEERAQGEEVARDINSAAPSSRRKEFGASASTPVRHASRRGLCRPLLSMKVYYLTGKPEASS
jgi:hypothetical protein